MAATRPMLANELKQLRPAQPPIELMNRLTAPPAVRVRTDLSPRPENAKVTGWFRIFLRALVPVSATALVIAGAFLLRPQPPTQLPQAPNEAAPLVADDTCDRRTSNPALANGLLLSGGNSERIALLSLRSINTQYTPQGDAALAGAARLDYPQQLFIGHTGKIEDVAYSPDGTRLASGGADGTVALWDVSSRKLLSRWQSHKGESATVCFSPDGSRLASGGDDLTVKLWDLASLLADPAANREP